MSGSSRHRGRGTDSELRDWRSAWQRGEAGLDAETRARIRRRTVRRSCGLKALAVGEVVFAATLLAFFGGAAVRAADAVEATILLLFALLVVGALLSALWNRRGLWRPRADTAAEHLRLSIARARRRLAGLTAGWVILAVEVALFVAWIGRRHAGGSERTGEAVALLALLSVAAAAALWLLRRYTLGELERLEAMRRGLDAGNPEGRRAL